MTISISLASWNVSNAVEYDSTVNSNPSNDASPKGIEEYSAKILGVLTKINSFAPDIICLQEFKIKSAIQLKNEIAQAGPEKKVFKAKFKEHEELETALEKEGYTLVAKDETVVAYKTKLFDLIKQETRGNTASVDLKMPTTGKVIRVISDHVDGFNITQSEEYRAAAVQAGDQALKRVLARAKENSGEAENQPCAVIYSADTNTTSPSSPRPIYPERLGILYAEGYLEDIENIHPTTVGARDNLPYQYDHILVKGNGTQVNIANVDIPGLDSDIILDNCQELIGSDHLPIFSRVLIRP
jgi:endonuclease/exonuclease/phosphatase family metal-dependent hydrolase